MAETAVRVWSTRWFTSLARLVAVGVGTGAAAGAAVVLLAFGVGGGSLLDAGDLLPLGALVGGASGLPVALLSAATGLVAAARAPQRRALAVGLVLVWPLALSGLVMGWAADLSSAEPWPALAACAVLFALVVGTVLKTFDWVSAPLR